MIALANSSDRLHSTADRLFHAISKGKITGVRIAASALLEYELLLKSKGISEAEIRAAASAIHRIHLPESAT